MKNNFIYIFMCSMCRPAEKASLALTVRHCHQALLSFVCCCVFVLEVVRVARQAGPQRPLEVFYFVEGPNGERVPAEVTAATLNSLDLQRVAIVLGHRVQRPLAQRESQNQDQDQNQELRALTVCVCVCFIQPWRPCRFLRPSSRAAACGWWCAWWSPSCWPSSSSSSSTGSSAALRSWSSSPTPSTPSSRGRRSEVSGGGGGWAGPVDRASGGCVMSQLQAPSVKGFDFAKLHLGQHSKDDIRVIQEAGPLPPPPKEATPSDGGDLNTPKSKGSSSKVARSSRRRGRSDSAH